MNCEVPLAGFEDKINCCKKWFSLLEVVPLEGMKSLVSRIVDYKLIVADEAGQHGGVTVASESPSLSPYRR